MSGKSGTGSPQWAKIDIYADGERVERLLLREGESFGAEVYTDDYRLEVVEVGPDD